MSEPQVDDDELVAIRIAPTLPWFEPPDRVSSANFKLDHRRDEQGLSVYRLKTVSSDDILSRNAAVPGSFLVVASARSIRSLTNAAGMHLHLNVIPDDEDGRNPGHAEIRGPEPGRMPASAAKALQSLFTRYDETTH